MYYKSPGVVNDKKTSSEAKFSTIKEIGTHPCHLRAHVCVRIYLYLSLT